MSKNVVTVKSESEVTQGQWQLYHSIRHPRLPINVP